MTNAIAAWAELKAVIEGAWAGRRVTPLVPARRRPGRPRSGETAAAPVRRDRTASWSLFIGYTDREGYQSDRRVSCLKVFRPMGGGLGLVGFCHEAQALREFRAERIGEMIDLSSGEVVEPRTYLEQLRKEGLPFGDRGLEAFAKVLVFMMRCDCHDDPREWEAIERALASYALRFDGTDEDVEQAMACCRALAPDATDFSLALRRMLRAPREIRKSVADLCGRACASVVDADGRIVDAEYHWGEAVDRCLRIIRG